MSKGEARFVQERVARKKLPGTVDCQGEEFMITSIGLRKEIAKVGKEVQFSDDIQRVFSNSGLSHSSQYWWCGDRSWASNEEKQKAVEHPVAVRGRAADLERGSRRSTAQVRIQYHPCSVKSIRVLPLKSHIRTTEEPHEQEKLT